MARNLTQEKRQCPTVEDSQALIRQNIHELYDAIDGVRVNAAKNSECLNELSYKLDSVTKEVKSHHTNSQELLENFKFQRKLRKVIAGLAAGLLMLLTIWAQSEHVYQRIATLFSNKP